MNATKPLKPKPFTLKDPDLFDRIILNIKETVDPEKILLNAYEKDGKVIYDLTILSSKKANKRLLLESLNTIATDKSFSVEMISARRTKIKKFTGGNIGYVTAVFDRITMIPEESISVALEIEALHCIGLVISFSINQVYNRKQQAYFDFFQDQKKYERYRCFHDTILRVVTSIDFSLLSRQQAENNKEFIKFLLKALDDPIKKYRIKTLPKSLSSDESSDLMITGDHNKEQIDHLDFINKMIEKKVVSLEMIIEDYYGRFPMDADTK